MPPLSRDNRWAAVGRLQAGQSQSHVARELNVAQSTISRLWARFQATGSVDDQPRAGRPRGTTAAQDRLIRLRHLRNRFLPASATAQELPGPRRVTDQTVRNRLRDAGLRAMRPLRGPVLTRRHCHNRLLWGNQHRNWTVRNNWRHVIFSDESFFQLMRHDTRRRVYRRVNERYAANCVQEAPAHGGGGVMVWAAISRAQRSPLIHIEGRLNAVRYVDQVLRPHALPLLDRPEAVFQHDNARPHSARHTTQFLNQNGVHVLPWPSMSPDMNPIEHLWDELDRRVRGRPEAPTTRQELFNALQVEWDAMPQQLIRRLVDSMPRRCQELVAANGGHTHY